QDESVVAAFRQRASTRPARRALDPSPGGVPGRPCGAAVRHVRAAFTACLLSWYPALDDWASGNQRIPRRSPPPVRRLGGGGGHHCRPRRSDGLVQRRAKSVWFAGSADFGDRWRDISMVGTFLHRTMQWITAAGIGLLCLPGTAPAQEQGCAVPASFYDTEPTLPKTAAAIASGQTVLIVTIGGASTLGQAGRGPRLSAARRPA